MAEPVYHRVASTSEIALGKMLCAQVKGVEVLVCHVEEGYFAVDNTCSHADAKLSEGRLRGNRVLCPLHGAAFDVRDGSVLRPPAVRPIGSHRVRVVDGDVWVALRD